MFHIAAYQPTTLKTFPEKNIGNKYIYPSIEGNNPNIPVMNKNGRSGVNQETERDSNLVL